ncbi:MAG TPA: hypothetical protein VGA78_15220 [Gemmatimonadales bacterium]
MHWCLRRVVGFAGLGLLLPLAAAPAQTIGKINTCHCNDPTGHGYSASSNIPIFTGTNQLRFLGPGVELTMSVVVAGLPGTINARRPGELDVTMVIPAGFVSAPATRAARLKYPIGQGDFQVRIIPRGTVSQITFPTSVTVSQPAWVEFRGSDIREAAFGIATPLSFGEVSGTRTFTATTYRTQLRFQNCGKYLVGAFHLHQASAPLKEIQNRNAQYLGTTTRSVTVTGCTAARTVVDIEQNRFALSAPVTTATGSPLAQNGCQSLEHTFRWTAVTGATGYQIQLRLADGRTRNGTALTNSWTPSWRGPAIPAGTTSWTVRPYQSVLTATTEERYFGPWATSRAFTVTAYQATPTSGTIGAFVCAY